MNEDTLLAEILANPDDDAPRLVYADALIARGDPRGELIQLQCHSGYSPARQEREREIMDEHHDRWREEAGIVDCASNFFRGFPGTLIGSCRNILASHRALATQPITSLSMLSMFDGLEDVLAMPELARIRELHVGAIIGEYNSKETLPVEHWRAIASSPHLANVRDLRIEDHAIDREGACVLATAAWLPKLEKLSLPNCEVGVEGIIALAQRLVAVRRLGLAGIDISDDGARAIATSAMRSLDFFWMPHGRLGTEGGALLANSPVMATVTHLDLDHCYVKDDAAIAIARSPYLERLQSLVLSGGMIGLAGAQALANSLSLRALKSLDLRDNLINLEGVDAFVNGTGLPSLMRLGLTANLLGTGAYVPYESDAFSGTYALQLTEAELQAKFTRPGLVIY